MNNENEQKQSIFSVSNANTRVYAQNCFAPPPPLDFVFSGVLAGSVAAIVAPGSAGKGFFALGVCFDLFTGKNKLGLNIDKVEQNQRIAFLTIEDHGCVLGHRIHSLINHYNMNENDVVQMDETIHFMSLAGAIILDLVSEKGDVNYGLVNQIINEFQGYRLVFIDTLARTHTANENSNGEMTKLISVFELIAKKTGAAFVFIHHTNKVSTLNANGDQAGAARGAAAITDNIRCQLNLSKVTKEDAVDMNIQEEDRHNYIWLHNSKMNYSKTNQAKLLVRSENGALSAYKNPRSYSQEKVCQFNVG